jgi:inner membrane protein
MAALSVLLVAAAGRKRLPWMRAWLLCLLGVGSHLLLDWTNDYGIRLFLPFSSRWFALDWTGLYDPAILVVLGVAALWPMLARLVSGEIGRPGREGRKMAVFALSFVLVFDCGRGVLHERAVAELNARLFDGAVPVQVAALPETFNPLRWRGVVETAESFRTLDVDLTTDLDTAGEVFYKPPRDAALEAAKRSEAFRYFLYFARFPVWSEDRSAGGDGATRVVLSDLRFGRPAGGGFHSVAEVSSLGALAGADFTYGDAARLRFAIQGDQPR